MEAAADLRPVLVVVDHDYVHLGAVGRVTKHQALGFGLRLFRISWKDREELGVVAGF
jgi:hypothetical protein